MTRKDYQLIAKALRDDAAHLQQEKIPTYQNMNRWEQGCYDQWNTTVLAIAGALQSDNPRFDRVKFLEACGV